MNKFAEKADAFSGTVIRIDGKQVVVQNNEQSLTFTVEGSVAQELVPGHDVTIVTWGNPSALRVVDHTANITYRPYYNADPAGEDTLGQAHSSPADIIEAKMSIFMLLPTVALATLFQSIPVYGWVVTYRMIANADQSIAGTAPQYEALAKRYFFLFIVLAFCLSGFMFLSSGDPIKTVLVYMTLIYAGTYFLMRHIFKGIEEIDDFTHQQIAKRLA